MAKCDLGLRNYRQDDVAVIAQVARAGAGLRRFNWVVGMGYAKKRFQILLFSQKNSVKIPFVALPETHLLYGGRKSTLGRCFMAGHSGDDRSEAIYQKVREYPGERPGFIARLLGLSRSPVNRSQPRMESRGYLLSEDERGGLWLFKWS